jgi:hypothetical protein
MWVGAAADGTGTMSAEGTNDKDAKPPRTLFSLGREGSKKKRRAAADHQADAGASVADEAPQPVHAAFCAECGSPIVEQAGFCGECGAAAVLLDETVRGGVAADALDPDELELDELDQSDQPAAVLYGEDSQFEPLPRPPLSTFGLAEPVTGTVDGVDDALDEPSADEAEGAGEAETPVEEAAEPAEEAAELEEPVADEAAAEPVEEAAELEEPVDEQPERELPPSDDDDKMPLAVLVGGAAAGGTAAASAGTAEADELLDTGEPVDTDESVETGESDGADTNEVEPVGDDDDVAASASVAAAGTRAPGEKKSRRALVITAAAAILIIGGIAAALIAVSGGSDDDQVDTASPQSTTTTTERERTTTTTTAETTTTTAETTTTTAETTTTTQAPSTTPTLPPPPASVVTVPPPPPSGPAQLVFSSGGCVIPRGQSATIGTLSNVGGASGAYSVTGSHISGLSGRLTAGASLPVTVTALGQFEGPTQVFINGDGGLSESLNCTVTNQ